MDCSMRPEMGKTQRYTTTLTLALVLLAIVAGSSYGDIVEGTQWAPYLEWSLTKRAYRGDPYNIRATVTFTHTASGQQHVTETFYDGAKTWKFRFAGSRVGEWTFATSSSDPDLNGKTGTAIVHPNPDPNARGFVTALDGHHWAWQGTQQVFVPQLSMYKMPHQFYGRGDMVDADIREFLIEHGFNGFHVPSIAASWFDIDVGSGRIERRMTRPDPRTFEALEMLIAKVYAAGGMVHIWAWGDHQRHLTPRDLDGGINGLVDRRLQRYIAARLGPIPGWTMGYGFDLWEWVDGDELTQWHDYMHDHFGWRHMLGARASQNTLAQLSEALDYSGYEQHRPDYAKYVETIEKRPDKPSFSEDRFRIRNQGRPKDYTAEETRRGLWHSTMAGGVANIWGNLLPPDGKQGATQDALPYPNKDQIKTHFVFFNDKGRFVRGLQRANELSTDENTRVLRSGRTKYIFYRQDATSIHMDLSTMTAPAPAVAVDTKKPYEEIRIGSLAPAAHTWQAPYASDWAIAVGTWLSAQACDWDHLALFARHWLETDCTPPDWCTGADLDCGGDVNLSDFAVLAARWQLPPGDQQTSPTYNIDHNNALCSTLRTQRPWATVVKP